MMDYIDLGAKVRACRRAKKLTQIELAEQVGISASFLGHIERGTRVASVDTLVALCNTLQVRADYLLSASLLSCPEANMPAGLDETERERLSRFLQLAQDTVRSWNS